MGEIVGEERMTPEEEVEEVGYIMARAEWDRIYDELKEFADVHRYILERIPEGYRLRTIVMIDEEKFENMILVKRNKTMELISLWKPATKEFIKEYIDYLKTEYNFFESRSAKIIIENIAKEHGITGKVSIGLRNEKSYFFGVIDNIMILYRETIISYDELLDFLALVLGL